MMSECVGGLPHKARLQVSRPILWSRMPGPSAVHERPSSPGLFLVGIATLIGLFVGEIIILGGIAVALMALFKVV